ncbi:MAG: N-acetyltransferase, partial [Chloroflexota bacterium]
DVKDVISLVAEKDDDLMGHIMFSPVTLIDSHGDTLDLKLTGLAPVSVRPEVQKSGVGSALIWEGLENCRRKRYTACFLIGHPEYYPRFGFKPALSTFGINSTYDVPDPVFMGQEFIVDQLKGLTGTIHYHPVFAGL